MRDTMKATDTLTLKRCPGCHRWLEATTENFHRGKGRPDGLQSLCKQCNNDRSSAGHMARRARLKEARA